MIPYNPKNWFTLIFTGSKSQLMKNMLPNMIGIGLITGGMVYLFQNVIPLDIPEGVNIHSFVGIVLGLVLVFRTNTAYDRWWEGRRLLGLLTQNSRNLATKLNAILPKDDWETRQFFAKTIPNYFFALKEHLREGVIMEELHLDDMPYGDEMEKVRHVPNLIIAHLQGKIQELLQRGVITGDQWLALNNDICLMVDVCGGCERIQKTPIPVSYSIYIKKVIFVYLLTMPLSTINSLHYYSIPMVMFTTYVLAGIELLAEEIEDPFGHDYNDLDTDGMAARARANVQEILFGGMGVEHLAAAGASTVAKGQAKPL
jgi:ion channel-forming bestrophin family protein